MSDYALTGKKGTGKSSGAVRQIQARLRAGKRVATNLNIHMEHLMPAHSRAYVIRLRDKPTANDLFSLGSGNPNIKFEPIVDKNPKSVTYGQCIGTTDPVIADGFDENDNGLLVLDEMGTWLNSRSFQDPSRAPVLDWLAHGRKFGWDVFYLMQNITQVDKQLRESFIEYCVRFHRLDKIKIPGVSALTRLITAGQFQGQFPRFHIGVMRLGCDPSGWWLTAGCSAAGTFTRRTTPRRCFKSSIRMARSATSRIGTSKAISILRSCPSAGGWSIGAGSLPSPRLAHGL
ncbi:zonular occludens toxin domain-containing protein [Cupriavidus sp. EM10]|uniref:zonular occludens toxin domain-containing protein n=1 Tax=Cupriavidus sp. EM10 TaxID=2839983 RepID=UPI001C00697A|nr:zonular occludens toxin domain-containing protein [Cupriavidus sp. EM10]QWE95758.1 hypothetical protein KLP38_08000 [Cupriavidus sp. EM10]